MPRTGDPLLAGENLEEFMKKHESWIAKDDGPGALLQELFLCYFNREPRRDGE